MGILPNPQSPIDNIYLKYIKNNLYLIIDNILIFFNKT